MKAPSWSALLVLAIVLCGCGASQRETTIKAALAAVQSADGAYAGYDKAHQESIVMSATSLEDGRARLAEYRAKRAPVIKAFIAAYTAIEVAATLNDDRSLASMRLALQQVLDAVNALMGVKP